MHASYHDHSVLLLYAWLSVVVFILALAYVVVFFVTLEPQATEEPPLLALGLNLALFGVFAIHHSVMARSGVKRWLKHYLPVEIERATYVWVASVLLIVTCLLWRDLPGSVYAITGWLRGIAITTQCTGVVVIAMAVSVLGPLELAGVQQVIDARRPSGLRIDPNHLRIRGPYRWVRHPIYLGWILAVFGAPDMSVTRLSFASISTAYLIIAVPWEEATMAETRGEVYQRYCERVRWRIMPGLW